MLFLLVAKHQADFEDALRTHFPNDHLEVHPGAWIISVDNGQTSKDVWDRLVGDQSPTGMIVSFVGYFGREGSNLWEWIATKRSAVK